MRRTALIVACLAVGLAGACSDGNQVTAGGSGSTKVLLTDAPLSGAIARADLYIKSIEATTNMDTSCTVDQLCTTADWVTIATPQKTFNLLDFQNGTTILAGEVNLPAGQYRAVRVVINTALSSVTGQGGAPLSVQWPVAGELTLYAFVEDALDVPPQGAQIVIDFDLNQTFIDAGNGSFWFSPVIRAVNNAETGTVAGLVTGPDVEGNPTPIAGAYVTLFSLQQGGGGVGTRTDASGHYVAAFVHQGSYNLEVQGAGMFSPGVSVDVTAGQTTTKNVVLIRDSSGTDTTGTGGGGGGPDTTTTGGGQPTGAVASVTIQPATQTVSVGDSVPVMAILKNDQGQTLSGRAVTWTLSDSSKVTVFGSFGTWAVLRATHSGSVTVTAAAEGKTGSGTVTIR